MIKVFTDSGSDLTPQELEEFQIGLLPFTVGFEGQEYSCELDWSGITIEKMTEVLSRGQAFVPGRPPLQEWIERLQPWYLKGYDLVYVAMSQLMTGSLVAFNSAVQRLKELYGEKGEVLGLDSRTTGKAQGLLVLDLASRISGSSKFRALTPELKAELNMVMANRYPETGLFIFSDSEDWLVKNGRIPKAAGEVEKPVFYIKDCHPTLYTSLTSDEALQQKYWEVIFSQVPSPEKIQTLVIGVNPQIKPQFKVPQIAMPYIGKLRLQSLGPTILNALGPNQVDIAWITHESDRL